MRTQRDIYLLKETLGRVNVNYNMPLGPYLDQMETKFSFHCLEMGQTRKHLHECCILL